MSAEQTPDIAAVLAEHVKECDGDQCPVCECLWADGETADDHRAHVAAALAPVLDAAVREAEQRAWDKGVSAAFMYATTEQYRWYGQPDEGLPNPYRADRITEPVSHEAATSGEEASKA